MKTHNLSLEYQRAKRNYKASKTARSNDTKENCNNNNNSTVGKGKSSKKTTKSSSSKAKDSILSSNNKGGNQRRGEVATSSSSAPKAAVSKDVTDNNEQGLKLLNLTRPSDCRTEGISEAIQTHLVESIKLCGLKARRETSIIGMIQTLCNHLTSREKEIGVWQQFSDTAIAAAATKIQQLCLSRDQARHSTGLCQVALRSIKEQYSELRVEHDNLKRDVEESLSTLPPIIESTKRQLELKLRSHADYLHSESKSEVCDAIEELARTHDNEKQALETTIHSLTQTVHSEAIKLQSLQNQFDDCQEDLDTEKTRYLQLRDEISQANKTISQLEKSLENERISKQKEIAEMDARMQKELDGIDRRVRESFKALTERKDKEVDAALQRARHAERILLELKDSLGLISE
ncbi:hypothetical protein ACHAWC_007243 [Mediolabrus comicus]